MLFHCSSLLALVALTAACISAPVAASFRNPPRHIGTPSGSLKSIVAELIEREELHATLGELKNSHKYDGRHMYVNLLLKDNARQFAKLHPADKVEKYLEIRRELERTWWSSEEDLTAISKKLVDARAEAVKQLISFGLGSHKEYYDIDRNIESLDPGLRIYRRILMKPSHE